MELSGPLLQSAPWDCIGTALHHTLGWFLLGCLLVSPESWPSVPQGCETLHPKACFRRTQAKTPSRDHGLPSPEETAQCSSAPHSNPLASTAAVTTVLIVCFHFPLCPLPENADTLWKRSCGWSSSLVQPLPSRLSAIPPHPAYFSFLGLRCSPLSPCLCHSTTITVWVPASALTPASGPVSCCPLSKLG